MDTTGAAKRYADLVDEQTRQEIVDLEASSSNVDELWRIYGEKLGLAATGEDPAEAGKKSFKRRLADIRSTLCKSKEIQAIIGDPAVSAQIDLALVFAGKLLESQFGGVNIALVAVLVAKIGLHKLCRGDEF